ncbi:carbonic anhydrase [Streptomyces misionensis]|uniref:carbonic anhydrase n=1 Tax=Streptomyces misionensis TaxID=67331 RepID=UPI0036B42C7D
MQPLIDNARDFGRRPEEFARLAAGQSPGALFITCSGSRVVPALITGARPGQPFEPRTAGNIVPPHTSSHPTSEAATEDPEVAEAVQCHALTQLPRLRSYPCVERALARDRLTLHGWYYEVHTGAVRTHRPRTDTSESL